MISGYGAGGGMMINASNTNSNDMNELYVNVTSDFYKSTIYSQPGLSTLNIDCNSADVCSKNKIYGEHIDKSLTYSCNGPKVNCKGLDIHCPFNTDSECNIFCSFCQNTNIYTKNNFIDINLECINDGYSCIGSSVYCDYSVEKTNHDQYYVDIIYNETGSEWIFDSETCEYHHNSLKENEYYLINDRSTIQYLFGGCLFVLSLCFVSLLCCYFMQKQQEYQQQIHRKQQSIKMAQHSATVTTTTTNVVIDRSNDNHHVPDDSDDDDDDNIEIVDETNEDNDVETNQIDFMKSRSTDNDNDNVLDLDIDQYVNKYPNFNITPTPTPSSYNLKHKYPMNITPTPTQYK